MKLLALSAAALSVTLTASGCGVSDRSGNRTEDASRAGADGTAARLAVYASDREGVARIRFFVVGEPDDEAPAGAWRLDQADLKAKWMPFNDDRTKDPGRASLAIDPISFVPKTYAHDVLNGARSHESVGAVRLDVGDRTRLPIPAGSARQDDAGSGAGGEERTGTTKLGFDEPGPTEARPC